MGGRSAGALVAFFSCLLAAEAQENLAGNFQRVYDERSKAVVRVEAYDSHGKLSGTGFFADPAGTIYTLAYIVANADEIFVVQGENKRPARLLVADPRSGVALIKVDENSAFIPLGDPHQLGVATPVMTIGYSSNYESGYNFGLVGGLDRSFLGKYFTTTHIRANLPVQAGFGGAPLLNLQGQAVGIIISSVGGGTCYAVPIDAAEKIRMDYARFGEPRHGWVGVNVEAGSETIDGSNVRVAELGPDTPAAQCGLKPGDTLLQVGSVKISQPEDVIDASYFLTAGDKVAVVVVRDGQKITLEVRSANHPATGTAYSPEQLHALLPEAETRLLRLEK